MSSSECCLCGGPVNVMVRGGRRVVPDYCAKCGATYDRELGEGWERSEWAQEVFRSHRRLMYCEQQEAGWERLDPVEGRGADLRRRAAIDRLSTDAARPPAGPKRALPGDLVIDGVIVELLEQGLGGKRIHRELTKRGWDISRRSVYYRLAAVKARIGDNATEARPGSEQEGEPVSEQPRMAA